jgi:hypothetical protein
MPRTCVGFSHGLVFASPTVSCARWLRRIAIAAGVVLASTFAGTAEASDPPVYLIAQSDPGAPGTFRLEFPDIEVTTEALISQTDFALRTEKVDAGARFIDYAQRIGSLTLPGGVETGNLFVTIVESRGVSYDPRSGEFRTDDVYAIYFDGDLSEYGIQSPFYLPGASTGVIASEGDDRGTVELVWDGEGFLPNPRDPKHPLRFTYQCRVQTDFGVYQTGDFRADRDVDAADYAYFQACFSGADSPLEAPRCELADFDGDEDVDLDDYATLESRLGNPGS